MIEKRKVTSMFTVRMWNAGEPLGWEDYEEVRARDEVEAEEIASELYPDFDRYEAEPAS